MDPAETKEWIMSLDAPLPGESVKRAAVSPATEEAEGAAFLLAMQQLTGGGR